MKFVEDTLASKGLAPISVQKLKWRPKTASIWEEENEPHKDPNFDSVFQLSTENSLSKSRKLFLYPLDLSCNHVYSPEQDLKEFELNLILKDNMPIILKN
jgi:hypothetical protein